IMDLVLPLLVLIGSCVFGMLYTGGILEGKSIIDAFAECSSAKGLVMGSFMALVFTLILYVPRKILDFTTFCSCFVDGFKQMASAIFILCLAWTLSGVCGESYLNIGGYVGGVVSGNQTVAVMLPAMFFLVALGLAFATGTSWGTFGILIPIVLAITGTDMNLATITVAAVLAGAVGGDHVSPISDTTILASAGAQCNHIDHVSTQIPYVLCVSSCCVVGYIVAGVTGEGLLGTFSGIILLVLMMAGIYKFKMK
ncbi:Na+/H+ antiporter NhaC family protein, partial [Dialister invisus]|uniref:Na+/H+ antiporter NhaC family protein n=1 Tax=Dialister invisus TaxID=218538 RepID=UPI003FD74EA4